MTLDLLTPEQAAELLRCTPATVEDRLRDGTLPGVQIGRAWLIPGSALLERLHELALQQAAERRQAADARPGPGTFIPFQPHVPASRSAAVAGFIHRRKAPPELTP